MNSAQQPGTQHTTTILSASSPALSPSASPMLSPIRAQPHTTGLSSSSSSSPMTFFNDPHWSSAQQLPSSSGLIDSSSSITATAANTTSGHFGSSVPSSSSSSSLHQHQHQQQQGQGPLVVSSNAFSSPLPSLMDPSSVVRFEGSLSPIDHPSLPTTSNPNQSQQGATPSQQALPHSHSRSHSQVVASNSGTRTTSKVNHRSSASGGGSSRRGGQGKPAISISTKGTSGSGSVATAGGNTHGHGHGHGHGSGSGGSGNGNGGRNAQPKSTRKQFSACGACQLRQLSLPHFPWLCIPLTTRRLNLPLLSLLLLLFLRLPHAASCAHRVKCDLKDKRSEEGEKASCTACLERGVNCV